MKNLLFRTYEPSDYRTFGLESSHRSGWVHGFVFQYCGSSCAVAWSTCDLADVPFSHSIIAIGKDNHSAALLIASMQQSGDAI